MMDIDHILKQTIDKDNSNDKVIAFNRSTGVRESLNENLIPEQLFDDPKTTEKEAQGISAVKALQLAAQQGQTIYTITQANYTQILPKLNHSDDVMTDVRNAINEGKEVTISQTQVHAFGWSGTGYVVLDPESGVGGYLIGGGADGGWIDFFNNNGTALTLFIGLLGLIGTFSAPLVAAGLLSVFFAEIFIPFLIISFTIFSAYATYRDMENRNCKNSDTFGMLATNLLFLKAGFATSKVSQVVVNILGSWLSIFITPDAFEC